MSLNKAIEHKKEKRKPYRGWAIRNKAARNHGSDYNARDNRLHKFKKTEIPLNEIETELKENIESN